jgi:hypothetical protein
LVTDEEEPRGYRSGVPFMKESDEKIFSLINL